LAEDYPIHEECYVRDMFTRIARRYDLMNCLMTGGRDAGWRREVIRLASLPRQGRLLDLGAGTGALARTALRQAPGCLPIAADFSLEMMRAGQRKAYTQRLEWVAADALQTPFPSQSFDAVVSGFLLRNLVDLRQGLREQYRLLKTGGRMVALDTTRPRPNLFSPLIHWYLHFVIPRLGQWITGDREAYTYLPDSTESFLTAESLAAAIQATGFRQVGFRCLMFGTIAIHWGTR